MKFYIRKKPEWIYYLLVAGIFLIMISPNFLSRGMFMDGLIYASVAKNLSEGIGSFWNPCFSSTFLSSFHEHPPLAFGLQSLFFSILGDGRWVEKCYSLFMIVLSAVIIIKIWKTQQPNHAWFPLWLWLSVFVVSWACCNNMLENTLTVFVLLSVFFYLKSLQLQKHIFLLLSGLMISLGFLTKGFVAFFPWTLPFIIWLILRNNSFRIFVLDTVEMVAFTLVPLLLLILLIPDAKQSLNTYIHVQVINSLKNVITVDTRFFIVIRAFTELIPVTGITFVILIIGKIKNFDFKELKSNFKESLTFILLGLSGVLPVMLSMKQSGFYILPTYPLFAIGIGILIYPLLEFLFRNISVPSKSYKVISTISCFIFVTGIILNIYFSNKYGRDEKKLKDLYVMFNLIPSGTVINIEQSLFDDWGLQGYFQRYKNISLDTTLKNNRDYLLTNNLYFFDSTQSYYKAVPVSLYSYKLFKKK